MAKIHSIRSNSTTPKACLTRGIDPIPPRWEFASSWAAIRGLARSVTTLDRLAEVADDSGDKASARDLRRCRSAAQRALDDITGGYERAYIEPLAEQWAQAEQEVAHHG
jgi:hypothetical protein